MTVWRYAVSWHKFQLALTCQLKLQNTIEKKPPSDTGPNYFLNLGKVVQYIFENYYNQKLNRTEKGRTYETLVKVRNKFFISPYYRDLMITFPYGMTEQNFKDDVWEHLKGGFKIMGEMGLLERVVKSERKWISTFRGLQLFSLIDFEVGDAYAISFYDGKGHAKKNADPRQLMHYGLTIASAGVKILKAGLIYWQHGYEEIDLSPGAIRHYVETDFVEGRKIFDAMKRGTNVFEANPTRENCKYCPWKSSCKFSFYRKEPQDTTLPSKVGFQ